MAGSTTAPTRHANYTDFQLTAPGTLAGRYMRRFWQPILRSVDLPSRGAKPIKIMSEQFTLYRGASGTPHLVGFRCAHRGTQLSAGWVEGDNLRCFYHGWMYDGSGQCLQQPAEDEAFASRIKIPSYSVQEYLGLIFAYLGEAEPPPLPRYVDFEDDFQAAVYERNCNYFNTLENLDDPLHTHFVHRLRWGPGPENWGQRGNLLTVLPPEETEWGWLAGYKLPRGTITVHAFGMPNIWASSPRQRDRGPSVDSHSVMWKVPIDEESHLSFSVGRSGMRVWDDWKKFSARQAELADTVLAGELTVVEAEAIALQPGEYGTAVLQDSIAQAGQGKIWNRENEHLGRSDLGLVMRRKLWARELRALAEGRPLKQWYWPEWLDVHNWEAGVAKYLEEAQQKQSGNPG